MKTPKLLSTFLFLSILALSSPVFALLDSGAHNFPDVPTSNQNAVAIDYLAEVGTISGYSDGTFKPTAEINRAELMKILVGSPFDLDPQIHKDCFPDVKSEWFAPYVCYAKKKGWVSGYPDGSFQPANKVNRAEGLKMIYNAREFDIAPPRAGKQRSI